MNAAGFDHFVFGSLHLELRGSKFSAVVSDMQRRGVRLEHVHMMGEGATLVIGLGEFWELYRSCRSHGVKVRILARQGMPFMARHLKRRKMMVFGAGVFLGILILMNSLIWQVTVMGAKQETEQAVLQAARDSGLYVGAWKGAVADLSLIQARMLKRMPSLIWTGIEINGSKANIKVVERIPGVTAAPTTPRNLVAGKPAVIVKVFATRGDVLVKPGQVVQPGQVLVSGNLGQGKLIPATGHIWAEVWYTSTVSLPLSVSQQELTGQSNTHQVLAIGPIGLRILGWQHPHYTLSTQTTSETDWHLGAWKLPIQWRVITDYQVAKWAQSKTTAQALETAKGLAIQDVQAQIGKENSILGQTVLQSHISHGKLYATVLTRVEEDIGVAAPIPKPSPQTN